MSKPTEIVLVVARTFREFEHGMHAKFPDSKAAIRAGLGVVNIGDTRYVYVSSEWSFLGSRAKRVEYWGFPTWWTPEIGYHLKAVVRGEP